jgi:CheY-like chemotaxis protein
MVLSEWLRAVSRANTRESVLNVNANGGIRDWICNYYADRVLAKSRQRWNIRHQRRYRGCIVTRRTHSAQMQTDNASSPTVVLLVDDDENSRLIYRTVLAHAGIEVMTASDGAVGLLVGRSIKPRVIVLDIGLPTLDGFEVMKQLRQDAGFDGATIIALTGRAMAHEQHELRTAGFDRVLLKPIEPSVVLSVVREALDA